jgi:hypothetical protein
MPPSASSSKLKLKPIRFPKYIAGLTSSAAHPDLAAALKGAHVNPRTTAALASYIDQLQPSIKEACANALFAANKSTLSLNLARTATRRLWYTKASRSAMDTWCMQRVEAYRAAVAKPPAAAAKKRSKETKAADAKAASA